MLRVLLRDTETGKTIWYEDTHTSYENVEYVWGEGNFACDCNRSIFFNAAMHRLSDTEAYKTAEECGRGRYIIEDVEWNGYQAFRDLVYSERMP